MQSAQAPFRYSLAIFWSPEKWHGEEAFAKGSI